MLNRRQPRLSNWFIFALIWWGLLRVLAARPVLCSLLIFLLLITII